MENIFSYEEITNDFGIKVVRRLDLNNNESWIPVDPANADYIAYLEWQENQSS